MPKYESTSKLSAAERECYVAEQRIRECLVLLNAEHRRLLSELLSSVKASCSSGAELGEFLEKVEIFLNEQESVRHSAAAERELEPA